MVGRVKKIYIAEKGLTPISQFSAQVEEKKGVVGDRYYNGEGTFSKKLTGNRKSEITFIASEEIDEFNSTQHQKLDYGDFRRNIVTQGVQLKELIGKEFTIGPAKFLGIEHCEPCAHLASTVNQNVLPHLVNSGLRAAIIESGEIEVGHELAS